MRILANLLSALVLAIALGGIALLAVQNVTLVSLKFLGFESVQIAIGLLLAFCVGLGLVLGALFPLVLSSSSAQKKRSRLEEFDDFEFDFEE